MTDFVAILHRTIGGLSDNSPEMREKVFDKARATIQAKLTALDPPPPQAVIDRQMQSLEDAIGQVRSEYEPEVDEIDQMFADETFELEEELEAEVAATEADEADLEPGLPHAGEPDYYEAPHEDDDVDAMFAGERREASDNDPMLADDEREPPYREARPPRARKAASGSRRFGMAAVAVAVLLVIAAGAAAWMNQDRLLALVGAGDPVQQAGGTANEAATPAVAEGETEIVLPDAGDEPAAETEEVASAAPVAAEEEKFTQRLLPDGSEVDEGPAGGRPGIGEGTSVAASSGTEGEAAGEGAAPEAAAPAGGEQVAVGQRAIFYEERTNAAQGSAEPGNTVWSIVQESPGGDAPPEPAIRAEAMIPAANVQLRMTIRRNADPTLPASHIIEMIFLTPENFAGGAIDNVLRVAMKDTEEATGSALMGIPAKIADGFFLVALSDSPAEVEANLNLLSSQSWLDIPVIYRSGRRALMTMEKGVPGERVFQEAIQAWEAASSG
jgi:hypothetical protein